MANIAKLWSSWYNRAVCPHSSRFGGKDTMHLLNKAAAAMAVVALGSSVSLFAQEDPIFRSDTRLVLLHATVVDKKGQLVTDLQKSAFKVLENNVEQTLKLFKREDVPVTLGLVIDNSGSMKIKRKRVEQAALALVKASNTKDEIFIVNFNDVGYLDVTMTSNMPKMEEGLARIDSRGGTAMRDALALSIDYIKQKGKNEKKVILIITDGDDTASSPENTVEKTLVKAQKSEVLMFAIGLLNEESKRDAKKAERVLKSLASQSGGVAHFPAAMDDVEKVALQVAHEIRNQYILAYSPTKPDDGSFRKIAVQVKGKDSPVVRTRTGYYAGISPAK